MTKRPKQGAVAVAALAAAGVLAFAFLRSAPAEASYPAERAASSFVRKVASRFSGAWRGQAAAAENVRLRRRLAALALDREELSRTMEENARLRALIGYAERARTEWIAAEVLSHGGGAAGAAHTLRAGKGSLDGVREGAVAESPDGLVGRVRRVTPHTCEIALLTDPSVRVSCAVEGTRPEMGILSGGTEDALLLRHLRAGAEIAPGSPVVTSGLGGVFPKGIAVGSFSDGSDAADPGAAALEREGRVTPAVDFAALEDVFIRKR